MTRLLPPKRWILTRDTRLESGEHQIDGYDSEGFPIRFATVDIPPGMHLFTDANGPEEGDDQ